MTTNRNLYIDIITFEDKKAFGYNEYILNLLNYLYAHRHNLIFDHIYLVINETQIKIFSNFTDKFQLLPVSCKNFFIRAFNQTFWNLFKSIGSKDTILCTSNYSPLFPKGKMILVIHDLLYKHKELASLGLMGFQRRIFVPISIRNASKIICISNFTKKEVINFYPKSREKVLVVYNTMNYQKFGNFRPIHKDGFLVVSSNAKHKNTEVILRAYEQYVLKGGKQCITIIGTLNSNLKRIINEFNINIRNKIIIKSNISNSTLGYLYNINKVYISASKYEGLGMPIAEAMYFNMILILPDEPDIFHEISNGEAIYFDQSISDLCNKMLVSDILPDNGIRYDLHKFTLQNTANKYIDLLNRS